MSKDERKDEKKLVNFRADSEMLGYLEGLAGRWGCGVTAVIGRAVRESYERETDTRLDEILEHLRGLPATFIETMDAYKARNPVRVPAAPPVQPVVRGGLEPLGGEVVGDKLGWLPCRHCGAAEQVWPKAPNPWKPCSECARRGHMSFQGCEKCVREAHAQDLAAKSTAADTEGIDFDPYQPA